MFGQVCYHLTHRVTLELDFASCKWQNFYSIVQIPDHLKT